ncbi:MAG: Rrf2 family transcriptional regulator [Desulfobacterales bacterium]|jgi:Rrf2 family protein|nr:Rrf2 family transcriptional regulator [Desulfobacterales bacterium]
MRLTRAGEYAIRCALYLSIQGRGVLAKRSEVAAAMDIPGQFLGKIARQLSQAGIIEIVQGAGGGYRLMVPPHNLTLLDVVEAVIGEIFLNDCVAHPETCHRSTSCAVHLVWEKARAQLRETLRRARFSDLAARDTCIAELIRSAEGAAPQPAPLKQRR